MARRHLLVARIVGARAAHPPQHVRLALVLAMIGTSKSSPCVQAPRLRFGCFHGLPDRSMLVSVVARLPGMSPSVERQVAAHVHDIVDLLDQHRAFVDARVAGGADSTASRA